LVNPKFPAASLFFLSFFYRSFQTKVSWQVFTYVLTNSIGTGATSQFLLSVFYVPLCNADADVDGLRRTSSSEISVSTVAAKVVGTGHHVLKVECYSWLKVTHHGKNSSYIEPCAFKARGHV
jgi:hypothetical protein